MRRLIRSLALVVALVPPAHAEGYLDLAGLAAALDEPVEIGKSLEGRPILLARLARGDAPLDARPTLLIVAGLAPDHAIGQTVAARLAVALRVAADGDEALAALLDRCAVEIVPCLNPDGLAALATGPARARRSNARPVDEDRDGFESEDGPDDLDGDGVITTMRVRDARGAWRISEEDPRLMVRADAAKGEVGGWRVEIESLDDDGDGRYGEDGPGGVDLDRNFAHGWQEHDPETGRSCPSEPETLALIRHVLSAPRIAAVLVLGHRDNLVKTAPVDGAKDREPPTGWHAADHAWAEAIGETYRELTGAKPGLDDVADGGFHQWAYAQRGLPAFATRVWHRPPPAEGQEDAKTEDGRWLAWLDASGETKRFVPWTPFDHPTLGRVEIGGFAPGARVNPPAAEIDRLVDVHAKFVAALLARLPRVEWRDVKTTALAAGAHEIEATLANPSHLPVIGGMGEKTRAPMPVRVTLDLPRDAFLHGGPMTKLDRLDGEASHRFRWVVRVAAGTVVRLRAWTERAGIVETEVRP